LPTHRQTNSGGKNITSLAEVNMPLSVIVRVTASCRTVCNVSHLLTVVCTSQSPSSAENTFGRLVRLYAVECGLG